MKIILSTTALICVFVLTSMAQDSKKEAKNQEREKQYKQIQDLVNSETYEFTGRKANPQKGRQVDLTTRPNFMRINTGNASADMPYFGRAFSAGYGTGGGVVFDGPMENYDIQKDDKKRRILIKFKVKGSDDTYTCTLTISSMKSASLSVSSNKRTVINYTGVMAAPPLKEE